MMPFLRSYGVGFEPESGLPADLGRSSHAFFEATQSKHHKKSILYSAEMSANNEGIAKECDHLLPDCARIPARQLDADWRLPLLVAEKNEVGSAPHAKLAKDMGDVELHGAFGDI
jgi:hypothetical protein